MGAQMASQPVILRRGPITGKIYAITKYRRSEDGHLVAQEKHDVTSDFDYLVGRALEEVPTLSEEARGG